MGHGRTTSSRKLVLSKQRRWEARGANVGSGKLWEGKIPQEVTRRLAEMRLPPDPAIYDRELQRLLAEHAAQERLDELKRQGLY